MKMRITFLVRLLPLMCWLLVGCGQKNPSSVSAIETEPANLKVSAAASLKDAMADIKQLYRQEHPNATITYNFGSSGSLQQQIEQGAPIDVFISAASKQMNTLQKKGLLIDNTRKNLLTNKVVLIAPKNATNVSGFKDLTSPSVKKIALGEPTSVPVGKYAQEILTSFGVFTSIEPKVVYGKDVRQIVSYVETGNVDVGIVYKTDIKQSNKVKIVAEASGKSHSPVVYPVAALKDSKNTALAQDFVQFLSNKPAEDVFAKYGFIKITKTSSTSQ